MKEFDKNNPFKTPEEYFENFDARLFDKLLQEKSNIPKEDAFIVPDDYFESLHSTILDKIDNEEIKVIPLKPYQKYYYFAASIAAVVLLLFGITWNIQNAPTFDDLAASEIESYFENNEFDLSDYEIAEVIPVNELEISDFIENQFNEENVIDYLHENTDSYEELNLEYDK